MTIVYSNAENFYDGIAEMAQRGLTFKADFDTFTITLTGGF